jgi:lipoyl-dependent peroxiredoxin subunit C
MPITVGDRVPVIKVPSYVQGRRNARLTGPADLHGRWVVLAFYPGDTSDFSPLELASLAELAPALGDEGASVMAASTGSWLSHHRWFQRDGRLAYVRYPVLADTSHELATAFGVLERDGSCRRATFLIDPEGIVRHATISDVQVARSAAETLRVLRILARPRALRIAA